MSATTVGPVSAAAVAQPARRMSLLRAAVRIPRTRVGLVLSGLVVLTALAGPFVASHTPTEFVGMPFSPPGGGAPLGTDDIGRDVLSRFLYGGRTLLALSVIATLLGVGLGTVLGVVAGYRGGWRDEFVMRTGDVVLAFPQVVAALLCLSIIGPKLWLLVTVVGVSHAPRVARIIRDATLAVVERDFVKAAEATGVRRSRIMAGEILPNITGPLMVELGLRLTYSIGLVAALSFLGLGLQPPTADWGLMINENRIALTLQPWPVVVPVIAIAVLTIGTNLVTDGLARASAGLDRGGAVKAPPIWTPTKVMTPVDPAPGPRGNGRPVVASVQGLRVVGVGSGAAIVDGNDLDVRPGEVIGLVGESGSGKTTMGLALLSYYKRGTRFAGGHIVIGGRDICSLPPDEVRLLRGRTVAYIPQSPASALNPALRIRTQLRECVAGDVDEQTAAARIREVLREVALPETDEFLARYPHQLSGGQQQRIAIAMAFIGRPELIVLDEPTTGLDVTTQKHVLETVRRMCATYACAAVYISHDMAVVADLADRIAVMYSGRTVESGPAVDVLRSPRHPYTTRLLMAVPDLEGRREMRGIPGQAPAPSQRPHGCAFAPRCPLVVSRCREEAPPAEVVKPGHTVRCFRAGIEPLRVVERAEVPAQPVTAAVLDVRGLEVRYGTRRVLRGVDLAVPRGHCVALLGESGSGKTTLSRCISGLHRHYDGEVRLDGTALPHSSFQRTVEQRRRVQYVFQNPYESLNPRKTVRELVLGPARVLLGHVPDPDATVTAALEQASLRADLADRYPDQLSGGERQRVAIARALAAGPDILICDEVTSALDVSVQSAIVELLAQLQRDMGLTLLFVTHDIALVRNVAQSVAVLERGKIVEHGLVTDIFADPQHPYTRGLIADTPTFRLVDEVGVSARSKRSEPRSREQRGTP